MTPEASAPEAPLPPGIAERRTHPHLRAIFEDAYLIVEPILNSSVSSTSHFIRIAVHDAYPDLPQQDISMLCGALERVYRERRNIAK